MPKKKTEKKKSPGLKRKPRSQPLPGMEDARIPALETVAADYADIRDQRIALNVDESKLKDRTLHLMRQNNKTVYKRNGLEIRIEAGEETVKVKIRKAAEEKTETVTVGD